MGELRFYLTTGQTAISRLIRMGGVGAHYSHVGIVVGRNPNPLFVAAHWDKGVQNQDFTTENFAKALTWTWVTIPCTAEQEARHLKWVLAQRGKPYDKLALIGMVDGTLKGWERLTGWPSRWFCSAFAFQSILEASLPLSPVKPAGLRTISPIEFAWIAYALGATFQPAK